MPDPPGWNDKPTPDEIRHWLHAGTYVEFSRWSVCSIDDKVGVAFALPLENGQIAYTIIPPEDFANIAERVAKAVRNATRRPR